MRRFGVLLALCLISAAPAAAQTFLPDDPLWDDPDRLDMPAPVPQSVSDMSDFLQNTATVPGDYEGPALNVNTLGAVPRSSWYTPRHAIRPMSIAALRRGPNTGDGPAAAEPWGVTRIEEGDAGPRLEIEDARGERYLLAFDPPGHLEMATGAAVVSSKLLYALGYHVPETYAVRFEPEQLVPAEDADLSNGEIRSALRDAPRYDDGTLRAAARKRFEEEARLGPFRYWGTRPDDGNDIFPHEGRRELRGLRAIAAWINYVGARSSGTLDLLVREDGRRFVRHYLVDFANTLGGGAAGPKDRWAGHEYAFDFWPAFWRAWSLGFAASDWATASVSAYPSVGRFAAEGFDPQAWVPRVPNPAFQRADERDLFWAAQLIMQFSSEEIRALASTGQYSDAEAERYLAETLIKRREKIGRAFLPFSGGLSDFRVAGDSLVYADLLARHRITAKQQAEAQRQGTQRAGEGARVVEWRAYDNEAERLGALLGEGRATPRPGAEEAVAIPEGAHAYLRAAIETPLLGRTHVFLRRTAGGYEVVGLTRVGAEEGRKVRG